MKDIKEDITEDIMAVNIMKRMESKESTERVIMEKVTMASDAASYPRS